MESVRVARDCQQSVWACIRITENIYYSQLSSVAILLQPEPVSRRLVMQGNDCVFSHSVLSSFGFPLPPTCLVLTVSEARSYFAYTIVSRDLERGCNDLFESSVTVFAKRNWGTPLEPWVEWQARCPLDHRERLRDCSFLLFLFSVSIYVKDLCIACRGYAEYSEIGCVKIIATKESAKNLKEIAGNRFVCTISVL
jgi:hypothetical protein